MGSLGALTRKFRNCTYISAAFMIEVQAVQVRFWGSSSAYLGAVWFSDYPLDGRGYALF
jgi:hypothetical protein